MSEQLFSDGIGAISIVGGIVRIDFVVLSPTEKDAGGQPKAIFQHQLVMGAEAFLRSTEKMQGAAQALAKLVTQPTSPVPAPTVRLTEAEPSQAVNKRPFP